VTTPPASIEPFRITPPGRWPGLELRELWAYRELVQFLVWRDLKVRYKQTALGIAWAVIQPAVTVAIFTFVFGRLAGLPSEGVPYPVLAMSGVLLWQLFAAAVTGSSNSLVGSSNLLTKVYFPRLIIPLSAVCATVVDFGISVLLLIVLMGWYGIVPGAGVILLPVFAVLALALALAIGLWASALNVQYRDVQYVLPFALQVLLFASPVAYSATLVPEGIWRWIYALNPLAGVIQAFRAVLFGTPWSVAPLIVSAAAAVALLVAGLVYFKRMEASFADVV
jgi:lipopolysaccharide transport system permease protein